MISPARIATGLLLLGGVTAIVRPDAIEYLTGDESLENMLSLFHQSGEEEFEKLEGFGVGRTYYTSSFAKQFESEEPTEDLATQESKLEDIHSGGMQLFLDRTPAQPGEEAQRLVINHLFRDKLASAEHEFDVVAAELVSLLLHDEPCVYDIDELTIDDLEKVPTRPLDTFETSSLARVKAGEKIVFEQQFGTIRLFGELRAIKQCQGCHGVEEGTLLGAFSYRLRRKQ